MSASDLSQVFSMIAQSYNRTPFCAQSFVAERAVNVDASG